MIRLNEIFGFDNFIDGQWEIIERIFSNQSLLVIKQTGFGKSLCFQLPATFFEGTTLVFSPLIALMRDQVNFLNQIGVPAACINSDNSLEENNKIIISAKNNELKLLYIAPERQNSRSWKDLIDNVHVSLIVIDEAHCISVWGHDFRPAYKKIASITLKYTDATVIALTATANYQAEMDIREQIGDFETIRGSLYRDNLRLQVINTSNTRDKLAYTGYLIRKIEGTGIVFTGTKADAEAISNYLTEIGISNTYYHSKISNRADVEKAVTNNEFKCVVATNAFGMGIDKPDFRFIIHTQFPASPLHYYQEIGRAGRDGKISEIFLLWNKGDVKLQNYFINTAKPPIERYHEVISYLDNNPRNKTFAIAAHLDLEESAINNIVNDLQDQKIVESDTEYQREPTKFVKIKEGGDYSDPENSVLELLDDPITAFSISKKIFGNARQNNKNHVLSTLVDLIEKGLVEKIEKSQTITYYKLSPHTPQLNTEIINEVREYKYKQLNYMMDYIHTPECRMRFLCNNLEDNMQDDCGICDRCDTDTSQSENCDGSCGACIKCLGDKYDLHIGSQRINLVYPSEKLIELKDRKNKLLDGCACYFYDYQHEVGPDEVKSIKLLTSENKYDLIISLPENDTEFCELLSLELGIPHIQMITENNLPREQRTNWYKKREHAKQFIIPDISLIEGKSILLFDKSWQSGITIKELGKYLSKCGAELIQPVFISKT